MAYINAGKMHNRYVEDVINHNNSAVEFKKQIKEFSEKMPIKEIKKYVKELYALERKEMGEPERKTDNNDFDTFKKAFRLNIIMNYFDSRPESLAEQGKIIAACKNNDDKTLNSIVDKLYSTFAKEISENKLEEKVWKKTLIEKATEIANRKLIGEDFEAEFDPKQDRGNCAKGITVSLYRAAKEFGLDIYQTNQDKENAAHPKTLAQELDKYVKKAESGLLKDIENIKVGDIIFLANSKGEAHHAMMVSSFDEQGNPRLLGFNPTQRNIPMFESKKNGDPRKGILIDVKSFVQDKVEAHNREEISQMIFGKQKSSTR